MADRQLRSVPDEELPKLLQFLKCDFPRGIHAYSFVETLDKWRKKEPTLDIHILAPNGNYRSGVFFYITCRTETMCRLDGSLYAWSMDGNKKLSEALASYDLEWDKYDVSLTCMQEQTWNSIEKTMREKWSRLRFSNDNVYWMPWQEAKDMKVEIPDTMYIEDLKPEHARVIDSVWPHRFPGSAAMIRRTIRLNLGLGLFVRGSAELISWAVHWFHGGLAAVQTLDDYKGIGCASAAVEAITRKMGHRGLDVHLSVQGGNGVVDLFFTKLGFRFAFNSVSAFNELSSN